MASFFRNFLFALTLTLTGSVFALPAPVPGTTFTPRQLRMHHRLLHAIAHNNIRKVKTLLAHGAQVNAVEYGQATPLVLAVEHGYEELCKILIAHGADVNGHARHYTAPIIEAVRIGHEGICTLLLTAGARLDNLNRNLLHHTACAGLESICKLLLEHRAAQQSHSLTIPLIAAAAAGHTGICKLLIAHGADATARGPYLPRWECFVFPSETIMDTTALDMAAKNGHRELSEYLREVINKSICK